jgi:hypothetical protein
MLENRRSGPSKDSTISAEDQELEQFRISHARQLPGDNGYRCPDGDGIKNLDDVM